MSARLDTSVDRWWMVRAEGGSLQEYFRSNGIVAAGNATPKVDLSGISGVDSLREHFEQAPGGAEFVARRRQRFGMVVFFLLGMRQGDIVVTPSKGTTNVQVGTVDGPYEYHPTDPHGLHLHRRVKWWTTREVDGILQRELRHPQDTVFGLSAHIVEALRVILRAPQADRL